MKEVMEWFPQAEARGQYAGSIQRIAALKEARPGDLTFLASLKFQALARSTDASVILAPPDFDHKPKHQQMILLVENPSRVLADICGRIQARNLPPRKSGIHPSATIDPSARIDPSAWIGPHCVVEAGAVIGPDCELAAQVFVGRNVQIGKASQLRPQVVVEPDSIIGERCILHPGVVIGADGFGYESSSKGHHKIPQIGCVVVEDEVEIGANSTVDRARFAETRIGRGTKIDNLVQIGHNVVIGKHGIFCGASGVSGSARIGDFVTVAGQVGIVGHIEIGDRVMIGGQSGVSRNLPSDSVYSGTPARPLIEQRRLEGWLRRLPEIHKSIKQLEKKIGKNVDE